jgi:hypothetical protein
VTLLTGAEGDATVTVTVEGRGVTMDLQADRFHNSFEALTDRVEAFDGRLAMAEAPGAAARINLLLASPPSP